MFDLCTLVDCYITIIFLDLYSWRMALGLENTQFLGFVNLARRNEMKRECFFADHP